MPALSPLSDSPSDGPSTGSRPDTVAALPGLASLVEEIANLKRVRAAHLPSNESWATVAFRQAWADLLACESAAAVTDVAERWTAAAVAAARLGAITPSQLHAAGLGDDAIANVFRRSVDAHANAVAPSQLDRLRDILRDIRPMSSRPEPSKPPFFVDALCRQPRAGATCPDRPRYLLDPPELHSEHCLVVAVCGVLAAGWEQADPGPPFVFGLTHHLHNATLADSGFAGEVLLGDDLQRVLDGLFAVAYESIEPRWIVELTESMRQQTQAAVTPEARSFHIADVLDRVAEMRHFERAATFEARTALLDLDLVHAGPTQAFGQQLLRDAGWWQDIAASSSDPDHGGHG